MRPEPWTSLQTPKVWSRNPWSRIETYEGHSEEVLLILVCCFCRTWSQFVSAGLHLQQLPSYWVFYWVVKVFFFLSKKGENHHWNKLGLYLVIIIIMRYGPQLLVFGESSKNVSVQQLMILFLLFLENETFRTQTDEASWQHGDLFQCRGIRLCPSFLFSFYSSVAASAVVGVSLCPHLPPLCSLSSYFGGVCVQGWF